MRLILLELIISWWRISRFNYARRMMKHVFIVGWGKLVNLLIMAFRRTSLLLVCPSEVNALGLPSNWFWRVGLVVRRSLIAMTIVVQYTLWRATLWVWSSSMLSKQMVFRKTNYDLWTNFVIPYSCTILINNDVF